MSVRHLFAAIVLGSLAVGLSALLRPSVDGLPRVPPPAVWSVVTPPPPSPDLTPSQGPPMRGIGWQLVDYVSAQGILMVTVETHRWTDTTEIARELVEPVKDRYGEILVYFRVPGAPLAERRVQWTHAGGYAAIDMTG